MEVRGTAAQGPVAEKTEGAKSWEALRPVTVPMGPLSLFSLPSPSPVESRESLCSNLDAG